MDKLENRTTYANTQMVFKQSQFYETNLLRADFRGAKNYNLDIYANKITGAKFSMPEVMSLLVALNIEIE